MTRGAAPCLGRTALAFVRASLANPHVSLTNEQGCDLRVEFKADPSLWGASTAVATALMMCSRMLGQDTVIFGGVRSDGTITGDRSITTVLEEAWGCDTSRRAGRREDAGMTRIIKYLYVPASAYNDVIAWEVGRAVARW